LTLQLQEWRNDQWSEILRALHPEVQSLWRMIKRVMRDTNPTPPLVTPGGIALSDSEKAEALADSHEAQFQPVTDLSDPAVIETVDVALRAYSYEPASEPILTDLTEVQHAIQGLKISKAPGPDGIPNRALKHLRQPMILQLVALFNERGLLRDEQFGFRPKHRTSLQLARLVERLSRNFGENRLTGGFP
jgi:DNA-binding PucR family transcriptional regulator